MDAIKAKLLREIQQTQFAVVEANLYLDTHPTDQEAIAYFQKAQQKLQTLRTEYEQKYGMLVSGAEGNLRWTWVEEPWPWQLEG